MVALAPGFADVFRRRSLLIADHEQTLRSDLGSLFRQEGFETYLAGDDSEAVRIVQHEQIDVVILELELPHGGGLEVLRVIRRVTVSRPPIVLTAVEVSGRARLEALAEDAFTVVPKPFDEALMKRVVASAIRGAHLY